MSDVTSAEPPDEPRITIEMGGPNIVIRASAQLGRSYTETIAEAINAASDADTTVVVDPDPIRCDDRFASYQDESTMSACRLHEVCRPVRAQVVAAGIVRLDTEHQSWLVDVGDGRLCRHDGTIDHRFLGREAWTRVVAICVTRSRLIALLPRGELVSARRAHGAAA